MKPNEFLGENDEEITLCFISAGFGGTLLPVCKSAAIFRHKAIGITVGLNFVKILQFFFLFCESSVIIGTFQGEDVE